MATIACTNTSCPESGLDKELGDITLYPDEQVFCGGCGEPIDVPPDIRDDIETRGAAP